MTQHQTRRYYDTFSEGYENERHHGYHRWLDTRTVALLRPHATGRRVLEVGCGTGLLLQDVAPVAEQAVGLDLSHGMLTVARRRALDVVEGSATALPFGEDAFDVVYSFKVLAHVPDLPLALRELARVTRPGGVLILEFYNKHSLRHAIRLIRPAGKVGHATTEDDVYTRFHTQAELLAMMPPDLSLERVDGLRIATMVPKLFALKRVEALEDRLSASPLRRFGGFLILTLRKGLPGNE